MAHGPEKKVKDKIAKTLKELDAWFFMPPANGYGRAGIPDFIGIISGHPIAIEAKAGKNQPTALQLREIERIRTAGGTALIVNEENVEDLKAILEKAVK